MARRKLFILALAASFAMMMGLAHARQHSGGHGGGHHGGGGPPHHGGMNGGGFGPFFGGFGVGLPYFYAPVFVVGPGMFFGPTPMVMPNGPLMPLPPPGMLSPPAAAGVNVNGRPAARKAADPARAAQLVIVGDRLLRAGNLKKAEERYLQAMRAAPDLAAPRVHLAHCRGRAG